MTYATFSSRSAFALFVLTAAATAYAQAEDIATDTQDDEIELISLDELRGIDGEDYDDEIVFEDEVAAPKESDLDELRRTFEMYKAAIASGTYSEADTLAKRMVELSIRLYGLDSHESSKALTNLGLVQEKNKDYESAILNFTAAIGIIERIEDRLNSELINPLRGLGAAQLGSGRPDLARGSFASAVHISHVNEGPHNLMQIEVLENLAETYLTMGDRDEALDVHEHIYNLEARNTDLDSEAIIPALERQADWLHRMSMYDRERMTWRRIVNILEDSRGKRDLSLIAPLTGLAKSYLFVSNVSLDYYTEVSMASGDTYLKRAVRIAEDNPDATWTVLQKTLLTLGDYYTLSLRASKAKRIYQEAWTLLSEDEERMDVRAEILEKPHILQSIYPPKYYNSNDEDDSPSEEFEVGTILLAYRVNDQGSTRDIQILDADPVGLEDMEYNVSRELRRMIYRPRMENGQLVETDNMTYTHEFFFRPGDLPHEEVAIDPESETSEG